MALVAVAIALSAQALTVHFNRQGNWTALYCTGATQPIPPSLAGEPIYRFADTGFDGQYYHYIAHDPFVGAETVRHIDDARLRYRRILVPALAYALALGRPAWIDPAYLIVIHLALFAGALATAQWAAGAGYSPAVGLAFLAVPAVVVSLDRMTADLALCALSVLFVLLARSSGVGLYAVLLLAPLVRETGLLLVLAVVLSSFWQGRRTRALVFATAALPTLAWYVFVHARTAGVHYPASLLPLSAILSALVHPMSYAGKAPIIARMNQVTDTVALLGVLAALLLALRPLIRRAREPVALAIVLFGVLGLGLQRLDHWQHVFDFGRVYSPLLIFLATSGAGARPWASSAPMLLMQPRILLQLGSQLVGVGYGMARWLGLVA